MSQFLNKLYIAPDFFYLIYSCREDDVEKTKQPNDLPSDSSEDDTPKKTKNELAESDDEFDHFYD